jgi:hypothetical protein
MGIFPASGPVVAFMTGTATDLKTLFLFEKRPVHKKFLEIVFRRNWRTWFPSPVIIRFILLLHLRLQYGLVGMATETGVVW